MMGPRMEQPVASTRRLRWVRQAAPWVITAGVVAALLVQYPIDRIGAEVARGDTLAMVPVAAGVILIQWFAIVAGDLLVLRPIVGPIGYVAMLRNKAGVAVTNALGIAASYGGYAVWIQRRFRCPTGAAIGAVMFISLTDLCAVATIASVAMWVGEDIPGVGRSSLGVIAPAIAAVALGLMLWPVRGGRRPVLDPWRRLTVRARLAGLVLRAANILLIIVATWIAARAFGMPIPLGAMLSYLPVLLVVGAMPINVAGFGPVQAAWVAMFAPWAPGEQVLAFQFLWHALMLAALVVRGAPFLRGVVADVAGRPAGDAPAATPPPA